MMFSYIPVHLLSGWNGVFPFTLFLDTCIYMVMIFTRLYRPGLGIDYH